MSVQVVTFLREFGFGPLVLLAVWVGLKFGARSDTIKARFRRIYAYVIEVARWAAEAIHVATGGGIIIAVVLIALYQQQAYDTEQTFRLAGLVLQVFGTTTVIWAVLRTRKDWGLERLRSISLKWLKRFPKLRRHATLYPNSMQSGSTLDVARLTRALRPLDGELTVDTLATLVTENLQILQDRISAAEQGLETKLLSLNLSLEAADRARKEEAEAIRRELLKSATGSLHISAIGAAWLIVGIILGTAPKEIADIVAAVQKCLT
jgi:hypothetical protein